MAYALLVERVKQKASALNMAGAVAAAMGANDVDVVTIDELLEDLNDELEADLQRRQAAHSVVLEALGAGRG